MRNLRIGPKLMVSFGAITVILLCVAGFAGLSLSQMNAGTTLIVNDRVPKMNMASEMNTAMADFRLAEAERALADNPARAEEAAALMRDSKAIVERDYAKLEPIVKKPIPRAAWLNSGTGTRCVTGRTGAGSDLASGTASRRASCSASAA